jgi:hypothetical protein
MSCCNAGTVNALNAHATGLGDRFRNAIDIINVVRQLDPTKLADIAGLVREISTAPDTKSKVIAAMKLASVVSSMTANTVDDAIVDLLDKVLGGPALDIIISLVDKLLLAKSQAAACSDDDLTAAAATFDVSAAGFDIGSIVALAKLIMQIISLVRG